MPVLYGGVDLDVLGRFKLRASEALVNGWVERGVRDACEVICRYPGATTMWSCHGHGPYSKKNSPGEFHVVFVLGVGFEHKAHELVAELMKADIPPLWDLSMTRLMYPDDDFVYDLSEITLKNTYNAWKITYRYLHTEQSLREIRKVFHTVCKKVFN